MTFKTCKMRLMSLERNRRYDMDKLKITNTKKISGAIPIPRENIYTEKFIKASKEADENIRINKINNARAYAEAKNYFVV